MKGVAAMMLGVQLALAGGRHAPRRDLIFAYFADEEAGGGLGSHWLVEHRPDLFEGVDQAVGELGGFSVTLPTRHRVYALQTAERGVMWLRIGIPGAGGHAALTDGVNPIVRAAALVQRLAALRLDGTPEGAYAAPLRRLNELAGRSASAGEVLLGELGEFGRAIARCSATTVSPTVVAAGRNVNVVPDRAELCLDCRFPPGARDGVMTALRSALDDDMTCEVLMENAGFEVPTEGAFPAACQRMIDEYDPGASVVPWVAPAGSDAQRLTRLGIEGYGFMPLPLPSGWEHLGLFHAVDERIPVQSLRRGTDMLHALVCSA
jgi:acetylornithine deacetylase/succinyl-diaminopimelate desuccinylase-like protein